MENDNDGNLYGDDARYRNVVGRVINNTDEVFEMIRKFIAEPEFKGKKILTLVVEKDKDASGNPLSLLMLRPTVEGEQVLFIHLITRNQTVLAQSISVLSLGFGKIGVHPIHINGLCTRQEDCHYKAFFSVPLDQKALVLLILDTLAGIDSKTVIEKEFLG